MRPVFVVSVLCVALTACSPAPPAGDTAPIEYVGTLEPELISSRRGTGGMLKEIDAQQRAALGDLVPEGATVRVAHIAWKKNTEIAVFLVERNKGDAFVVADGDGSGTYEENEIAPMEPVEGYGDLLEANVTLTLEDDPIPSYDLVVGVQDYSELDLDPEDLPPARMLASKPVLEGTVDVGGRTIRVKAPYSFETGGVGPGTQSVDANYDGLFDTSFTSRETAYLHEDDPLPIYRVDDRYVSIEGIDLSNLTITLADHPAEEYTRVELEIGNELPDFEFTDLEGNRHRLSEYRGKYLLVDVWGTWCGPCRRDVPYHLAAWAAFNDKGFEILGLNDEQSEDGEFDEGLEKARTFVDEHEISWLNATEESVKDLLVNGLMVRAWPTAILLDPEGRIISLNRREDPRLRFDALEETLTELLDKE